MSESREKLIKAAANLFLRQSYQGTGVGEILQATGLSKGSFYHFFPSKEDLGLAVVAQQRDRTFAFWAKSLTQDGVSAPKRLAHLLDSIARRMEAGAFALGCPLGTMAQEMSSMSAPLREALEEAMTRQEGLLARCLREGQEAGEIPKTFPAEDMARCLWSSVQGALLMAKARRSTAPLEDVKWLYAAILSPGNAAQ
ncbi:TetR family transcriptional regulator [Alphaproteobacteria bacterium]|nr:TetR family transcriptional regulator [Alphaproteobacteria bacterium]